MSFTYLVDGERNARQVGIARGAINVTARGVSKCCEAQVFFIVGEKNVLMMVAIGNLKCIQKNAKSACAAMECGGTARPKLKID